MKNKLVIATRGSKLALWQAHWVKGKLEEWYPQTTVSLEVIKTQGDKILDVPLAKIGGKGLFVKEIEQALLDKTADIAVHSMKDVPTELPDELSIAATTEREDPRDALLSRSGKTLKELPDKTKIGTSSLRRKTQLLHFNPSFQIFDLRGNLDTRIKKLKDGLYDAILVATAGINRLGWKEEITEHLSPEYFLPAIGQGALGIETRRNDNELLEIVSRFDHHDTALAVSAERAFLKRLEGGCQVPIAAYATVTNHSPLEVTLEGLVGNIGGSIQLRRKDTDSAGNTEELGKRLAETLLGLGADKILKEVYGNA